MNFYLGIHLRLISKKDLRAGSAAQLQAQLQPQTEMHSARDDVTEADPDPEL